MKAVFDSRIQHYLVPVSIFLIIVALIAGTTGCTPRNPSRTEIRDWYDLDGIRHNLAAYYVLMNDLDSNTAGYEKIASPTANGGKGWDPIGGHEAGNVFSGTFDGNGHKICDLSINRTDEKDVALFGTVGSILSMGSIKNLGLVDLTVAGNVNVAGLLAASWLSNSVTNCHATGTVTGSQWVGGLLGFIDEGGTVTASSFTGSVDGDTYVGGLMGENGGGTVMNCCSTGSVAGNENVGGLVGSNSGAVINSYSTGDVTGAGSVGGLVGDAFHGTVTNCHATGSVTGTGFHVGGLAGVANSVTDSYATGRVTGSEQVGGLAGIANNVSNCYATGDVTGDAAIGGLVGWHTDGTVSNCYATGSVSGNYSGGLVGVNGQTWIVTGSLAVLNDNGSVAIYRSYSAGSVTGSDCVGGLVGENHFSAVSDSYSSASVTGTSRVGGLVGWNTGDVSCCYAVGGVVGNYSVGGLVGDGHWFAVSDSFWDVEASGQDASAGGTGKTSAEMRNMVTFSGAGWNIIAIANSGTRTSSYIWNIVDDVTYPFLSWQA